LHFSQILLLILPCGIARVKPWQRISLCQSLSIGLIRSKFSHFSSLFCIFLHKSKFHSIFIICFPNLKNRDQNTARTYFLVKHWPSQSQLVKCIYALYVNPSCFIKEKIGIITLRVRFFLWYNIDKTLLYSQYVYTRCMQRRTLGENCSVALAKRHVSIKWVQTTYVFSLDTTRV